MNLVGPLLSYVLIYKYLAIFVITYLGALAFPLPSGTVVMASTAFATQGYLSVPLVFLTALLGNVAGDNSGYWLTRRYGVRFLHFIGLKKVVTSKSYGRLYDEVDRHPILIIYLSRFMTGIAPAVNVISGTTHLPFKRYITFEFLGECTEVGFFCLAGYFFGANWSYINQFSAESWILLLSGAVLTYLVWKFILKKNF
ncbi:MAG: DedA family protein [Candidatus Pacebacteria bacterium]|nr:DedA family protein [Candidatus Paceibacterota bacterium]MDR3583104.1 DedA family protein [Candidatus Paceibacterota bacterium]